MFTLHNGDCLEYMKSLPDKAFDCIVTDPPYGLGIAGNPIRQKFERKDWDNATPEQEVFEQMFRVSKNQIIWGGTITSYLHIKIIWFGISTSLKTSRLQ